MAALASLWSCDGVDHSGEPALLTITVDSTAVKFSRLTVALKDSNGVEDVLFDDSLESPDQLRRLATENYRGGKVTVLLTGYRGGSVVFRETRGFESGSPAATQRDTAQDFSAGLSSFAWNTRETLLSMGDSAKTITLSALPAKSDRRTEYSLSDSSVLFLRADAGAEGRFRIVPRKSGMTWVRAVSTAHPEFRDSTAVQITTIVVVIDKPINTTPEWSTSSKPTWTWKKGGANGNGFFRVRLDDDSMEAGALVGDLEFTAPDPLPDGLHILYAQERDAVPNYSALTAMPIRVDTDPPLFPETENESLAVTDDPRPAWTWTSRGGGIGKYRVKVDGENLEAGSIETDSTRFAARDSLGTGLHVFRVQERDSAGNWSASGSATVRVVPIDTTPPNAPLFKPSTGGEGALIQTLNWGSGGRDGTGHYRYYFDKPDFGGGVPVELTDSSFTLDPDSDFPFGRHFFHVEERDSVGNWSKAAVKVFNNFKFSFIRLAVAGNSVLTLDPGGDSVRLAAKMADPKNDSDRELQRRQLWSVKSATGDTAKEYIRNDFRNLYLTHQGQGKPVEVAHFAEFPFNDSTLNWDVRPRVFVGGTPPEPYQIIGPSGTLLLFQALGPPFDESSALRVDEEYVFPSVQNWVIDLNDTWFLTN
jgi:hypothetical protein